MPLSVRQPWPILANWKFFFVLGVPIILSPLLVIHDETEIEKEIIPTTKFRCAYVILLMAIYWMVEAIPLAVTSLIPVVLFPLLGVVSTADVSINYMTETNMMFVAGLMVALGVEDCNLHKRIALSVMIIVGSSPIRLTLGIMMTTMFLSMWISNTATTAMMVPIALAILQQLNSKSSAHSAPHIMQPGSGVAENVMRTPSIHTEVEITPGETSSESTADETTPPIIRKSSILFAIAYSSSLGGTGSLTGTAVNLILKSRISELDLAQCGKYMDLTFATWMAYNVPVMLINVMISWIYLVLLYFGLPDFIAFWRRRKSAETKELAKVRERNASKMLRAKYESSGRMNFHETAVAILFFVVVMLWVFRDPRFMSGWGDLFPVVKVNDSTAGMFIVFLMFVIPKDPGFLIGRAPKQTGTLLNWKSVQSGLPWGVVLLMGGGFAISDAARKSYLSDWIGQQLNDLVNLPNEAIVLLVMLMTAFVTQVVPSPACANVIIPILMSLSQRLGLHPLYLTLPATVSCSFAFMLPVATPPNAIVYAAAGEDMRIMDMVKTGAFLSFTCITVLFLMHISYGNFLFRFDNYEYAQMLLNATTTEGPRL